MKFGFIENCLSQKSEQEGEGVEGKILYLQFSLNYWKKFFTQNLFFQYMNSKNSFCSCRTLSTSKFKFPPKEFEVCQVRMGFRVLVDDCSLQVAQESKKKKKTKWEMRGAWQSRFVWVFRRRKNWNSLGSFNRPFVFLSGEFCCFKHFGSRIPKILKWIYFGKEENNHKEVRKGGDTKFQKLLQ